MWSVISGDPVLAEVFNIGRRLRQALVVEQNPKKVQAILEELQVKGDIHRLNYEFFFGVPAAEVTSEQRSSIKQVAFGTIYGKAASTLAKDIQQTKEFVEKLLKKFFGRFAKASKWLEWTQKFGRTNFFTKSIIGRRRHLWGYLVNSNAVISAMNRRAMNAPIQGLGADIGHTMARMFTIMFWDLLYKIGHVDDDTEIHPACTEVMVHDSSRMEVKYEHLLLAVQMMQWIASRGVANYYKEHFNMDFTSLPEIEFEIGPSEDKMYKWNWAMIDYPLGPIEQKNLEKGKLEAFPLPQVLDKAASAQCEIYPNLKKEEIIKAIMKPWRNKKLKKYMDKHWPFIPD